MLAYTRGRLLKHQALVERDMETRDKWGANVKRERKVIATVPCLYSAYVEASRARQQQRATAVRTVVEIPALLIVAPGADIQEEDWIKEVVDAKEAQIVAGPFRVVGVEPIAAPSGGVDHIEIALERP